MRETWQVWFNSAKQSLVKLKGINIKILFSHLLTCSQECPTVNILVVLTNNLNICVNNFTEFSGSRSTCISSGHVHQFLPLYFFV